MHGHMNVKISWFCMTSGCCVHNSAMNSSTCRILKASRLACASENYQSCVQACFPGAALLKDTCLPQISRRGRFNEYFVEWGVIYYSRQSLILRRWHTLMFLRSLFSIISIWFLHVILLSENKKIFFVVCTRGVQLICHFVPNRENIPCLLWRAKGWCYLEK